MSFFPITRLIMASLFKKPATLTYPAIPIKRHESARGHIAIDIEGCIYCGICQRKCPADAIKVSRNEKEWAISHFACVLCGECAYSCPKKCLRMESKASPATFSRNPETVKNARVSTDKEHN